MSIEKKYIFIGAEFSSLLGGVLVKVSCKKTKKRMILPAQEAGLLLFCSNFETIENHAQNYLVKFSQYNIKKLLRKLCFFVDRGFLITEEEYFANLFSGIGLEKKDLVNGINIEIIGIPTTNRPVELDRALETFIHNLNTNNRLVRFVIADGSDETNLEINKRTIEKYQKKYSGTIEHLDKTARQNLANKLSKDQPLLKEIINFSILGNDINPIHTGALRNSIILSCAGKMVLFIDDDVICSLHTNNNSPDINPINKIVFSGIPAKKTSFFDNYTEATNHYKKTNTDYLAVHELLLGQNMANLISLSEKHSFSEDFGATNRSLKKRLDNLDFYKSKVAITYSGGVGDSWMRVHPPTMINPESESNNLWGSNINDYNHHRTNGAISRVAQYPTIYSGPNCISFNLGADLREMVPPFAPLHRSQDAIFGYLLHYCFKDYFSGFLPIMVEHRRNENRSPKTDPVFNFTTVGKVVITVISLIKDDNLPSSSEAIFSIGQRLVNFSKIDTIQAKQIILEETANKLRGFINHSQNLLDEFKESPDYWKDSVKQTIDSLNKQIENMDNAPFFWDVQEWQDSSDMAWVNFMKWLRDLGTLLMNWPEIFETALNLNKKDINL